MISDLNTVKSEMTQVTRACGISLRINDVSHRSSYYTHSISLLTLTLTSEEFLQHKNLRYILIFCVRTFIITEQRNLS